MYDTYNTCMPAALPIILDTRRFSDMLHQLSQYPAVLIKLDSIKATYRFGHPDGTTLAQDEGSEGSVSRLTMTKFGSIRPRDPRLAMKVAADNKRFTVTCPDGSTHIVEVFVPQEKDGEVVRNQLSPAKLIWHLEDKATRRKALEDALASAQYKYKDMTCHVLLDAAGAVVVVKKKSHDAATRGANYAFVQCDTTSADDVKNSIKQVWPALPWAAEFRSPRWLCKN